MSNTETPETEKAPETRVKCSAIQGGKRAGQPCHQWALPGSDRCNFHPHKEAELEAFQASGATTLPGEAQKLAQKLALADAPETLVGTDYDDTDDFPTEGEARAEARHAETAGEDVPDGYVKKWVLDPDKNDYVEKLVSAEELTRVSVKDPLEFTDAFDLGRQYHEGSAAAFDYRWANRDERQNRLDSQHGYVPVRQSLDGKHGLRDGAVANGDLILMRRPKEVTRQRAVELAELTDQSAAREMREFHEEARDVARTAHIDHIPTFGGMQESTGRYATEDDPESVSERRAARQAPEPERPRGARTFAFPNNPIGRDLVAERHRAVGG